MAIAVSNINAEKCFVSIGCCLNLTGKNISPDFKFSHLLKLFKELTYYFKVYLTIFIIYFSEQNQSFGNNVLILMPLLQGISVNLCTYVQDYSAEHEEYFSLYFKT